MVIHKCAFCSVVFWAVGRWSNLVRIKTSEPFLLLLDFYVCELYSSSITFSFQDKEKRSLKKKKALHMQCKLVNQSTSRLDIPTGSSPFSSDILHQGLPKRSPMSWCSKLYSKELGWGFDEMHGQHRASCTTVSLLRIKVKLELDTSDFFRALHKIVSTILTAKCMCN